MLSSELRDVECGLDFARLYELGCFQHEFVVYGVCYWENNIVYYLVSENPEKVYGFVNDSLIRGQYCSPVVKKVVQHNVASGTEDIIKREILFDVAITLKEKYGRAFFAEKQDWINKLPVNSAYKMLIQQQEALEGCFDRVKIELFEGLCYQALENKTLTRDNYDRLCHWVKHIYHQMEDDVIEKDRFKRDFAGFAYIEGENIRYFFDANLINVWEKRYELKYKGIIVTPVLKKQYWFSALHQLPKIRKHFKCMLEQYIDADYVNCVNTTVVSRE